MPDSRPIFYGSFRESNALFLTVVRPANGDTGLEVDIYEPDATTMVCTMERAFEVQFNDVDDELGSGQFRVMRTDPKAVECIPGRLVKYRLNGDYVFANWIKPRNELELAVEPQDEAILISGPSAMAVVDRAAWWYESSISDNIETELDVHWTLLDADANAGDTVLTVVSAFGSRYAVGASLTVGVGETTEEVARIKAVTATTITLEGDLSNDHATGERIEQTDYPVGTTWVTVLDGTGFAAGDYIFFDDEAVKIVAIHSASSVVFEITPTQFAHSAVSDPATAVVKGNAPFGGEWRWEGEPKAAVLKRFLDEAQARDPRLIPQVSYDFTEAVDSEGEAWDDAVSLRFRVGTRGVPTWRQLAAMGLESEMRHDLRLQAFKTKGVRRDGTTGVSPVIFEPGTHMLEKVRPERPDSIATHVIVGGLNDTFFVVTNEALADSDLIGRREDHISVSSKDPTTLQRAGEAYLELLANEQDAIELPVFHGPRSENQFEPYIDYGKGDWIGLRDDTAAAPVAYRIKGIFVGQDRDTNRYGVVLQLNSIAAEWEIRLQRKLDSLSATGSGGSGGGAASVGLGSSDAPPAGPSNHNELLGLGVDSHPQYQRRNEKGAASGYAPLSSGILVPVGYLGTGAVGDGSRVLHDDGTWKLAGTGGGGGSGGWPPGSIHALPGSPNAFDAEFDSSDLTAWTAYGTALDTEDADTTREHYLYIKRAAHTATISGRYKAVTIPGTYVGHIGWSTGRANYHRAGGFAILPTGAITSTSPCVYVGWGFNGQPNIAIFRHSQLAVWQNDIVTINLGFYPPNAYVRLTFASATSLKAEWSLDGYAWREFVSGYNPGWNMDKIGWAMSSEGGTVPLECSYDFIRRTA